MRISDWSFRRVLFRSVLEHVLTRYIASLVYQAVMENVASEPAARMVAMKAASDNAHKLIDELNLVYDKARQAATTQEISERVCGAAGEEQERGPGSGGERRSDGWGKSGSERGAVGGGRI